MNKFITVCFGLSALALITMFFNWVFKPSVATVVLSSSEWMCVESAPHGLTAQCTMYTRVATKKVAQ